MKKTCPICRLNYISTKWLKAKPSGYRAFLHARNGILSWCAGAMGQHFTQVVIRAAK